MPVRLTHHTTEANGIKLHYVDAGEGPPLILLHGFPETWYAWRKQIPVLGQHYRLIFPDLRRLRPERQAAGGLRQAHHGRRHPRPDGGARHPARPHCRPRPRRPRRHPLRQGLPGRDRASRLLDNVPTLVIFEGMDATVARGNWFFIFNQVADLPEALIAGCEEIWLQFILQGWTYDPEVLTPEDLATYVRAYQKPGTVRGAMCDYRAGKEDVAEDKADRDKDHLPHPRALGRGLRAGRPHVRRR